VEENPGGKVVGGPGGSGGKNCGEYTVDDG
jgi:hypothetical protein